MCRKDLAFRSLTGKQSRKVVLGPDVYKGKIIWDGLGKKVAVR